MQIFKQEALDSHELEVSIKEGVGGCDTVGGETQGMVRGARRYDPDTHRQPPSGPRTRQGHWQKATISMHRTNVSFLISPGEQSPAEAVCSHLIIKTIPLLSSLGLHGPDSLGPVIASLLIEIISIYYTDCASLFRLS